MKRILLRTIFLLSGIILTNAAIAQRYITNTYGYTCYNFFDDNTVDNTNSNNTTGVYAPGFSPDPNVAANNTSVVLSPTAAANNLASFTGRCLQSKYQATPKAILSSFIPNLTDAAYKTINNNDWEWSFLYRSDLPTGTYPSTPPTNTTLGLTANTNSWRYWLFSNNASITSSSTGGFYVTQNSAGKIVVYVVSSGAAYSLITSNSALTNGKTYCIKIQRLVGGSWRMYLDEYTTSVTQAKTLQTSKTTGSDGQAITLTYVTSAIEAENTNATSPSTDGAIKLDEIHMYTRYLKFTNVTSAANGVTQGPYYAGQGAVILWGTKLEMRGNYDLGANQSGDLYIAHVDVGNPEANFVNSLNPATLYRTTNPIFSTSSPTTILTSNFSFYNGTGNGQSSGFLDSEVSMGNTDGTLSVPAYWFLGATLKSSITTGTSIVINGVTSPIKQNVNNSDVTGTVSYAGTTTGATVSFGTLYDWKGTTSNAWNTTTNWSPNGTPGASATDIIRIGAVSYNTARPLTLSGTKTVSSVIIGASSPALTSSTIALGTNTLNTTNLSVTASTLNVTGTGTIKVSGTGTIGSTGILSLNSATLNNAGTFTLSSDASGSASIDEISNSTQLGGTGTYNVEKFLYGNSDATYRTYRFLSSPVYTSSQTLNGSSRKVYNLKYLTGSASNYPILTGPAGGGFDKIGNPTLYVYREDRNPGSTAFSGFNYIGISNIKNEQLSYVSTNNTTTAGYLPVGNGFALFYRGSKSDLGGRTTFPSPTTPDNTTLTAVGTPNSGSIPVTLWYNTSTANSYQHTLGFTNTTGYGNASVAGFTLVGNPYPSTIDWETFDYANSSAGINATPAPTYIFFFFLSNTIVSPTYYIFNPATKNFDSYTNSTYGGGATGSATQYIPSGQGFFVRSISLLGNVTNTTTLTFNESAKAAGQQNTAFMGVPKTNSSQVMRLKLAKDAVNTDDILLRFVANGSMRYNPLGDAADMGGIGSQVSLSSLDSTGNVMALKNFPPITEYLKIKLYVSTAASGLFSLTASQFETLNSRYNVYLKDNFKKDSLLISKYPTYAFNVDKANPATFGTERFEIVFHKKDLPPYALLELRGAKETGGAKITWKVDNEANYTYFELEKLNADNTYTTIYNVQSDGSGSYTFLDKNVNIGSNTYRLKQTDIDNTTTFSKDVIVMYANTDDKNNTGLSISPNPASTEINVAVLNQTSADAAYNITIYNASGNVVKRATSSQLTWKNNVSDLLPGAYIINVVNSKTNALVGKSKFIKL